MTQGFGTGDDEQADEKRAGCHNCRNDNRQSPEILNDRGYKTLSDQSYYNAGE